MTALKPAACAFLTLSSKLHPPLIISTNGSFVKLLVSSILLVKVEQASSGAATYNVPHLSALFGEGAKLASMSSKDKVVFFPIKITLPTAPEPIKDTKLINKNTHKFTIPLPKSQKPSNPFNNLPNHKKRKTKNSQEENYKTLKYSLFPNSRISLPSTTFVKFQQNTPKTKKTLKHSRIYYFSEPNNPFCQISRKFTKKKNPTNPQISTKFTHKKKSQNAERIETSASIENDLLL